MLTHRLEKYTLTRTTSHLPKATPVLVCPIAGDQFQNAQKAEELGVGMWVDRPDCHSDDLSETAATYRAEVAAKLQQISDQHQTFKKKCNGIKCPVDRRTRCCNMYSQYT